MQKELYIIRHGETEMNKLGIVQGSGVNAPLNDLGVRQAAAFYEHYRHLDFDTIITSSLIRTHETVRPFLEHGTPWIQTPDINEIGWGVMEGKPTNPAMKAAYHHVTSAWFQGNFHARIPGGESAAELAQRLTRFVDLLIEIQADRLLICSHGRALRCLMCLLSGKPISHMESFHHYNTGLYLVELNENRFEIHKENDVSHLHRLTAGR